MDVNNPLYHAAPLHQLVKGQLHKGTTLKERVRKLRHRRRRAKAVELPTFNDRAETGEVRL